MSGLVSTNGVVLAYDAFGEPGARAVVLLQGLAEGRLFWPDSTVETLLNLGLYVIAVDNRDIGESTILGPQSPPYTLEDMATDTIGLLDALHIRKAHFIGYSLGGMLAQHLAISYPQRVASLVLTMTTSRDPALPTGEDQALLALMQLADDTSGAAAEDRIANLWEVICGNFDYSNEDKQRFTDLLFKTGYRPAAVARQLNAGLTTPPWCDHLEELSTPTTIVHGDADRIFPAEHAKDLARRIPGADLTWLNGSGHVLCRHTAPAFNNALTNHLRVFAAVAAT